MAKKIQLLLETPVQRALTALCQAYSRTAKDLISLLLLGAYDGMMAHVQEALAKAAPEQPTELAAT